MMTSSNGNIFRVTGPLCGEFTGPEEFPTQRPVTRSFDVFFDLRLNKRLSKQPWGWWFQTPSWSLWRQSNAETSPTPTPLIHVTTVAFLGKLRRNQTGHGFTDGIFKWSSWMKLFVFSLTFHWILFLNKLTSAQIMPCRLYGTKPLSESIVI